MTEYLIPIPGTILPALEANPYRYPFDGRDVGAVQQYDQGSAQVDAFHMTEVARQNYLNITFANWLVSYQAGRLPASSKSPQPPNGFVVVVRPPAEDGSFIDQFDAVPMGEPVCQVPAYTKEPEPQIPPPAPASVEVGEAMNAESPAADGIPLGFRQVNPDGTVYAKRARVLPFGVVYFWLRVA